MNNEHLVSAVDQLKQARNSLCFSVSAFENCQGDFKETIRSIKETIGDLQCAIQIHKYHSEYNES